MQRRQDGSINFYRTYDEYAVGFGELTGEHWIGELSRFIINLGLTFIIQAIFCNPAVESCTEHCYLVL